MSPLSGGTSLLCDLYMDLSKILIDRGKFDTLANEKVAKEQLLLEQIEEHKNKVRVLEEYVELLEKKVSVISERSSDAVTEEVSESIQTHLRFYQMMTGMTIKSDESDSHKALCTLKNPQRRQVTRFYVEKYPHNDNEISFTPEANPEFLPEYLRSGVTFNKQLAPLMLGDILQSLFGESSE